MGGHACANTSRLSVDDLQRVIELVLQLLKSLGCPAVASPLELADKDSFGDVDIVYVQPPEVSSGGETEAYAFDEKVCAALGSTEPASVNGNTRSYLTKERFQVDLIRADSLESFPATNAFFSHGDLSTIMGNELSFWGLKLGMDGLSLDLSKLDLAKGSAGESKFTISKDLGRIWLSGDIGLVYSFLCLPAFLFDGLTRVKLEEMVSAIMSSPFFDPFRKERAASKNKHQQEVKRPAWAVLAAASAKALAHSEEDKFLTNAFPMGHPLKSLQWISESKLRTPPRTSEEYWTLQTCCADHFSRRSEFDERCRVIRCCHERWHRQRHASVKFSGATLLSWYPELCQNKGKHLERIRDGVREHAVCIGRARLINESRGVADLRTAVFHGVASEQDCLFQDWILAEDIITIRSIADEVYARTLCGSSNEGSLYAAWLEELALPIHLYAAGKLP